MSGIGSAAPPPPPPPSGSPPTAPPAPTVQSIPNPPPAVAKVPVQTTVDAKVIQLVTNAQNQTTGVQVTLSTPQGPTTLTLPLNLQPGTSLSLQVLAQNPGSTTIQITGLNGQALPTGTTTIPGAGIPANLLATGPMGQAGTLGQAGLPTLSNPAITPATGSANPLQPAKAGDPIIATFLRPATIAPSPGQLAGAIPGAPQTGLGSQAGPLPTGPSGATATPPTAGAGGQGAGQTVTPSSTPGSGPGAASPGLGQAGATKAAQPQTVPAGTQLGLTVTSVTPPQTGSSFPIPSLSNALPNLTPGASISGVVTGNTPQGAPIVQTPGGVLALTTSGPLPLGAQVSLEVTQAPRPPQGPLPDGFQQAAQLGAKEAMTHWRAWPAVAETAQTLAAIAPEQAAQFAATMPKPDNQLAANLLMFLGVLKSGEVKSWTGDQALRILQRAKPDAAGKLADDVKLASIIAEEPRGDWRVHLIPFFNGEDIDKIRMLTRHQPDDDEDDKDNANKGQRFVLDIELSRLGRMQLDGLVKAKLNQVDLIIRSDDPLPRTMQTDIQSIYAEAGQVTGMRGAVSFQAAPANFVELPPAGEAPKAEGGVLV